MEENSAPASETKSPSKSKSVGTYMIILAIFLVAIGAYFAGTHHLGLPSVSPTPPTEVLGTEAIPTTVPTEIPSLADESTPSPTIKIQQFKPLPPIKP